MAPEMVNDELYDMGIDIWSLGVLLYEMIHGYSPFRAHNNQAQDPKSAQVEIFLNIKNNKYTIDKQISEECTDLIAKLLTTDTKKRIKIGDIFTHPWVVNKEKEYFPLFNRTEIKNKKKISNNSSDNNAKINNLKQLTNKSCNFVYSKNTNNNEIGSNICFIQDKKNIIIKNKNQHNDNINIENNENNNKVNLTESNLDKIIELKKHEINVKKELITKPKADQKESYSKNNFNNMYSKKNKNILPRVNRTQKDIIIKTNIPNMKVSSSKIFENQKIKDIDTTIKLRTKANKNFPRAKSEQRSFIRVRKPELEEYFKKQKEVNDLNIKIKQIKEKRELALNTLREIESKNRREKSIRKLYESIKTNSSYDYYKKNLSLRNKFSYSNIKPENKIDTNINKNKIGSLSIRRFYDKNPNLKDQRSRSFQHLFTDNNTFEKKISSMMKELKGTNQQKSNLTKINFWGDNSLYKNINQNKENIIYPNNDKLKRFRKRVIHISKRNNINININPIKNNNSNKNNGKSNIFTSHRTMSDSVSKNNGNKINNNNLKNNLRENKSIQNIFYNTYYNCQFDKKYHITNSNDFNNNNNNKNNLLKNKYSFLKRDKELKSISSEKNLFKNKKIFEL